MISFPPPNTMDKIMQMLNGRILVLPDPIKDVTDGGVVIPDIAKEKPKSGKVICASSLAPVKTDDHVVYPSYAGIEFEHNKTLYHIVCADEIWLKT